MEQTIVMLAQEITRLRIIEEKYLALVSIQTPVPVILKIKNPKRVAAGKKSAEIRAAKKVILTGVYDELLANMEADESVQLAVENNLELLD